MDQDSDATRPGFSFGRWGVIAPLGSDVASLAVDSSKALYLRVLLARGRDSFYTLGPKTANLRNIWTWTSLGQMIGCLWDDPRLVKEVCPRGK